MRVVEGTPASQLHPAVASALKLPMPDAGATTLNTTPVAPPAPPVPRAPGPPDSPTRGVALPPTATPAASPAPPAVQTENPPASILRPGDMPPGSTESHAPNPQPQDFNHLNYDDDPILQQVKQQMAGQDSGAAADTLAQFQQMLLGYGSSSLARDVLGKLGNDTDFRRSIGDTLWNQFQAGLPAFYDSIDANGNPDTGLSTLAQLAYKNRQDSRSQDENYNQGNLFFSGAHGSAISDLARNYAFSQAGAQQDVLGKLASARTTFTNKLYEDQGKLTDAEQAAYERRLEEALKYGTGGPGSDNPPKDPGDDGKKKPPAKTPPPPPPMAGPPDDRARKGATPPPPAGDKRPKATVYKGRH